MPLIGFAILAFIMYWPYHTWSLHVDGMAQPSTYIILGMVLSVWINLVFYLLGGGKRKDD